LDEMILVLAEAAKNTNIVVERTLRLKSNPYTNV
jgi:hypothetical protein